MFRILELTDNEIYWLVKGMFTAYEAGCGFDSNYRLAIKTVRLTDCVKVIFEYTYSEQSNHESNPEWHEVKYFETYEHFNIKQTTTLLELNDNVMYALDEITKNQYDYGY